MKYIYLFSIIRCNFKVSNLLMSLKYLLGNSPKSYKESKYEGKTAQHSELHENKQVANEIVEFLWGR
ncbi:alpha/beta hydrolase [Staphylococcus sciuri]|nr:alpha/beta hydrolase [Mammaliicoccus sciuri]MCD5140056.1 alpha/beta hydrolase [Mammaliicoccus sciuri]